MTSPVILRPVYRLSGDEHTAPALQLPLKFTRTGTLRTTTVELLQTIEELFRPVSGEALAAAGIVLEAPLDGHTCLDATAIAERLVSAEEDFAAAGARETTSAFHVVASPTDAPFSSGDEDRNAKLAGAADKVRNAKLAGAADKVRTALQAAKQLCMPWNAVDATYPPDAPIVEAFGRYYPHRFAVTEQRIAQTLVARAQARNTPPRDRDALLAAIPHAPVPNPNKEAGTNPEQRAAIETSLEQRFMLLTGGPGTGKTWTVRALLAIKIAAALREGKPLPQIALAAPTGKAAARVVESLSSGLDEFLESDGKALVENNEEHLAQLRGVLANPEARTLHRLLGLGGPTSPAPETLFVNADIVVVDEVSMVDAPMMAQLFEALAEDTTLILIGDPNQLASVDAGSALADLVALCKVAGSPMRSNLVELVESRRFDDKSSVGKMAHASLIGDTRSPLWTEWVESVPTHDALPAALIKTFAEGYRPLMKAAGAMTPLAAASASVEELDARANRAFEALAEFQVLTSHRVGARSVTSLNEAIARRLIASKQMKPPRSSGPAGQQTSRELPVGTPVMILRNDYSLQRFNGDIGVVIAQETVSFKEPDGSVSHTAAIRLPQHMSAFAITVHKSQGSEWKEVAFLLPNQVSRLLTKELVYTAISRAKTTLRIYGSMPVLHAAITNPALRATGLVDVVSARLKRNTTKA